MKTNSLYWPPSALYSGILLALTCGLLIACGSSGSVGGGGGTSPVAPAITISSITPKEVPKGSTAVTVTVSGTNFPTDSVIVLNGVSEPTTYVSSTQLQATIPATQLQTGQVLSLAVRTSVATTNANTGTALQVDNPIPTVTTLAPSLTLVGSASTTVTITGTNFVSGVVATVNGNPRTTTFVSDTQLTVALPPTDLTTAVTLLVNVSNPQPGGGGSGTAPFTVTNPSPTVSALAPAALQVGGQGTSVIVTGGGFVNSTTVLVNGATRPTTYVSGTSVTVGLAASDLGYAGTLAVTAVNPGPGGGVSSSAALAVNNPIPGAITIAPTSVMAGTAGSTVLTVTGTGFVPSTVVQVNGTARPTTYVSSTQLLGTLSATDLVTAGVLTVSAETPTPGGGSTPTVNLPVNNPSPGSILVSPNQVSTATPVATSITVTGANFMPSTVVQVNGSARPTTYISSTQLQSMLTVLDQAVGGSLSINAFTPAPGGGLSPASSVAVNNPVLGALTITPTIVPQGLQNNTTISVTGSGFIPGTIIQLNGSTRTTSYITPTQLTFILLPSDAAATGKLNVTAVDPAPAASTSPTASLTVATATATPTVASVNPSSLIIGSPASSISVAGTGFTNTSVVQWNGSSLTTSYGNASLLFATVPSTLLTATGTASITVSSPSAVNPLSNAATVSITNPPVPTLTGISPNNGPMNSAAKFTFTGTGFNSSSTVNLNGTPVTTTFVSSSSLTVSLPASSFAMPGNYSFSITTPAPGGGTSGSQVYSAYIPLVSNNMIYNPVDGLIYASIPGSVAAPMGNSIVSINPATGAIGQPIFVGSEPNKLALTADGHYLWVGLDGSCAVRKVDLVTKTAGLQFSMPLVNSGIYNGPAKPQALAALPGASDSVIVSMSNSDLSTRPGLAIFDAGVMRKNTASNTIYDNEIYAIQVDASRQEIYAGGGSAYNTYTYDSNGLTQKVALTNISPASASLDEMQLLSGKMVTDFGRVYDAESGSLLGSLYVTGQTVTQGGTLADVTAGKIFVANYSSGTNYLGGANQIQLFNLSDYTSAGAIPVNVPSSSSTYPYPSFLPRRLTRWGANGLLFHTTIGIYSLRSNLIADESTVNADLGVTITNAGSTTTGANTTYTARITNSGPSTATDVILMVQAPATGTVTSVVSTTGSCSSAALVCSIGNLTNRASATVVVTVSQMTPGTSTVSAQVAGSATDPSSSNNVASSSVTITGTMYNATPLIASISPAAIQVATTLDTKVTVNGTGFTGNSTVMLDSAALSTTFVSATQLTATVPAASAGSMGWGRITVSTPAPGGGISPAVPLTYYSVIPIGVNHLIYDPYSRKIMATVGSGSSTVPGNSIAAIDPATATVGTPVSIGSQPTNLALSSDGQILYTILSGSQSIARYNMLSGQSEFTYQVPTNSSFAGGIALRGLAVQPGSENTIALDIASFTGNAIYDFDPVNKTAAIRGQASGPYSGSCIAFLNPTSLLAMDTDTSGFTMDQYTVTSAGFTYYNYSQYTQSTLNSFGCFKLSNGLAYSIGGGIADPSTKPATQVATLPGVSGGGFSNSRALEPDASLQRIFYPAVTSAQDGITVYDLTTYQPTLTLPLNMLATEGTSYSQVDLVRWGQDGLAILTSTGHIYLLRGPVIVPQLLNTNTPAVISSGSPLTHGNANAQLTITGSNFVPGVAVTWNGSYRTTTITDSTHLTVAIPASDVAAAGTATVVATNPGASASSSLTVTIQ